MGIHYPVHSNILLKIGATSSFDGIFIKSKLPKNMKMSFLSLELKLSQTHHSPSHKCLGIYYARNVTCICVPLWLLLICSWLYNSSSFPSEWNLSLFPENSSTRSFIANKHSFLPMLTIGLLLSRTCWVDLVNFRGLYENLPAQLSVNVA